MAESCGKCSLGKRRCRDLTACSEVRIVFLVAPNGSERSGKLKSRKHGAKHLSKRAENLRVFDCVGVVCELDSVFVCFLCLFFVFECFWLGLLAGLFCLVGFSGL